MDKINIYCIFLILSFNQIIVVLEELVIILLYLFMINSQDQNFFAQRKSPV
ncbi:hypothetical protein LACWKB10_1767 [Lactobacillus sp. wkB10]|nr:hypothetical protein LACWKB10_1767 [Lactobacillus sp. wkB10]